MGVVKVALVSRWITVELHDNGQKIGSSGEP